MRHFRFLRQFEDGDEPTDMIAHETHHGDAWWCDECGTCNDPERHGEWLTCLYCGAEREEPNE